MFSVALEFFEYKTRLYLRGIFTVNRLLAEVRQQATGNSGKN
jgi:hypothetical protein